MDIPKKACRHCGEEKALDAFDRQKDGRDGLSARCKDCRRAYNSAHYRRRRDGLPGVRERRALPPGHKACPRCGEVKTVDEFPRNKSTGDGLASYCKPCHNSAGRASLDRMGGARSYHLKRRYGLTAADVDAMVEAQGGVCALCRERPPEHVDHDHLTGQVRGVLCSCCNQGLGNFRDRAQLLRAAVDYLEATTWQRDVRVVRQEPGVYALVPS